MMRLSGFLALRNPEPAYLRPARSIGEQLRLTAFAALGVLLVALLTEGKRPAVASQPAAQHAQAALGAG